MMSGTTSAVLHPQEVTLLRKYNDKPIMTRPQHKFFTGPNYLEVGGWQLPASARRGLDPDARSSTNCLYRQARGVSHCKCRHCCAHVCRWISMCTSGRTWLERCTNAVAS